MEEVIEGGFPFHSAGEIRSCCVRTMLLGRESAVCVELVGSVESRIVVDGHSRSPGRGGCEWLWEGGSTWACLDFERVGGEPFFAHFLASSHFDSMVLTGLPDLWRLRWAHCVPATFNVVPPAGIARRSRAATANPGIYQFGSRTSYVYHSRFQSARRRWRWVWCVNSLLWRE